MALIPKVLSEIKDGPIHLFELYDKLKPELNDATDFYPSWIAYMLCGQQILIIKVRRLYAFRDVLPSVYGAG